MREMKDSGIEWIGSIPTHWKTERLQWHITEIKETNKPEKSRQVLSLTNKRGVIPYEEKGAQGNVSKEDYSQYKLAYRGRLYTGCAGELHHSQRGVQANPCVRG